MIVKNKTTRWNNESDKMEATATDTTIHSGGSCFFRSGEEDKCYQMLSRQDRRENSIHGIFSTEEVGKREVAQLDLCGHYYILFHCKCHSAEAFLMILQSPHHLLQNLLMHINKSNNDGRCWPCLMTCKSEISKWNSIFCRLRWTEEHLLRILSKARVTVTINKVRQPKVWFSGVEDVATNADSLKEPTVFIITAQMFFSPRFNMFGLCQHFEDNIFAKFW